jgi:hypothetical protein
MKPFLSGHSILLHIPGKNIQYSMQKISLSLLIYDLYIISPHRSSSCNFIFLPLKN